MQRASKYPSKVVFDPDSQSLRIAQTPNSQKASVGPIAMEKIVEEYSVNDDNSPRTSSQNWLQGGKSPNLIV